MSEPQILEATPDWYVVFKPSGWLTIPGRGPEAPVLRGWLESRADAPVFVVHRIDRETSGLVLFARTAEAHRRASSWFEKHQVKKTYECLAAGAPSSPVMRLKTPVRGAASVTQVEVVERFGSRAFLARARPLSGRRHQIRIHLSLAGYPLLGDSLYGGPTSMEGIEIERTALHARILELPSGEKFSAPRPADFEGWIKRLREGSR